MADIKWVSCGKSETEILLLVSGCLGFQPLLISCPFSRFMWPFSEIVIIWQLIMKSSWKHDSPLYLQHLDIFISGNLYAGQLFSRFSRIYLLKFSIKMCSLWAFNNALSVFTFPGTGADLRLATHFIAIKLPVSSCQELAGYGGSPISYWDGIEGSSFSVCCLKCTEWMEPAFVEPLIAGLRCPVCLYW